MRRLHFHLGIGWLWGAFLVAACQGGGDSTELFPGDGTDGPVDALTSVPGDGQSEFVSNLGTNQGGARGPAAEGSLSGAGGSANVADQDAPAASGSDGAQRAISEADVLQVSGDRLYALSRYSGLSVVDISNPDALRLEGSYRSAAEPFEMYVEDGIVFAMFNSWYSYECDEAGVCSWQTTSRMQALDARDPADIRLLSEQVVPGTISDSRRVGDILYLATQEWGYCWGCAEEANTTLTSFDVSDSSRFAQVDQLRFSSGAYGGDRSISVTNERIYISGPEYGNYGYLPSTVRVIDISDPSGALVAGDSFPVAGMITNRWQMDEFEGVFRVVSQPGGWNTTEPPVVQTFDVNSAADVRPLGDLTLQMPRPNEVLRSVRFDGARGYAITSEQIDPLFTLDLSEPATPRQLGQLEMPGFVHHMEPRGDRVFALGFDPANPDGSLNVSLFDVSNLAEPALLSRVAFGGDWGSFAEGQNQIHKAFSILPEAGVILVPFSGGSHNPETCEYEYGSGIQLVDFTEQSLARRGVAPQVGNARRAFLHRERLFGVGDNSVQTFDISDRDNPVAGSQLDVARNVSTVRVLGDHLMRFGSDWATNQTILDMTPVDDASEAGGGAEIDLSALFGEDAWSCTGSAYWGGQVFTRGNYAYVPRYTYSYGNGSYGGYQQRLTFYIVDLSDRDAPRAVGKFAVEPTSDNSYLTGIVQTDNALLVGRSQGNYNYDAAGKITERPTFYYDVIELSNPVAPKLASRFEVPEQIAGGGYGYFIGGCSIDVGWGWYGGYYGGGGVALTDGDLVVSQHSVPVEGSDTLVKYYLDRIDVSDPYRPVLLPAINIPGTAVHFNAETSELVTVDYEYTTEAASSWEDCMVRGYYGSYGYDLAQPSGCLVARRSINSLVIEGDRAVRKSQLLLDRTRRTLSIAVSDSRIFYTTAEFPEVPETGATPISTATPASSITPVTLETLQLSAGALSRLPSQLLRRQSNNVYGYAYSELFARGDRAFEIHDNTITVVDTADAADITRLDHELPNWSCQSLEVSADTAYCAVGQRGVEVIDLTSMR